MSREKIINAAALITDVALRKGVDQVMVKAATIIEDINYNRHLKYALNRIGILYYRLRKHELSVKYLEKSLTILNEFSNNIIRN